MTLSINGKTYEAGELVAYVEKLKKENAELKKNYEDSLVACGVLKEKIDLLSKPSPVEAMQDVLITTQKEANKKQNDQLTKAKEIIKTFLAIVNNDVEYVQNPKDCKDLWKELCEKAEQFISEVEK